MHIAHFDAVGRKHPTRFLHRRFPADILGMRFRI
jgi:hypothetical protein